MGATTKTSTSKAVSTGGSLPRKCQAEIEKERLESKQMQVWGKLYKYGLRDDNLFKDFMRGLEREAQQGSNSNLEKVRGYLQSANITEASAGSEINRLVEIALKGGDISSAAASAISGIATVALNYFRSQGLENIDLTSLSPHLSAEKKKPYMNVDLSGYMKWRDDLYAFTPQPKGSNQASAGTPQPLANPQGPAEQPNPNFEFDREMATVMTRIAALSNSGDTASLRQDFDRIADKLAQVNTTDPKKAREQIGLLTKTLNAIEDAIRTKKDLASEDIKTQMTTLKAALGLDTLVQTHQQTVNTANAKGAASEARSNLTEVTAETKATTVPTEIREKSETVVLQQDRKQAELTAEIPFVPYRAGADAGVDISKKNQQEIAAVLKTHQAILAQMRDMEKFTGAKGLLTRQQKRTERQLASSHRQEHRDTKSMWREVGKTLGALSDNHFVSHAGQAGAAYMNREDQKRIDARYLSRLEELDQKEWAQVKDAGERYAKEYLEAANFILGSPELARKFIVTNHALIFGGQGAPDAASTAAGSTGRPQYPGTGLRGS